LQIIVANHFETKTNERKTNLLLPHSVFSTLRLSSNKSTTKLTEPSQPTKNDFPGSDFLVPFRVNHFDGYAAAALHHFAFTALFGRGSQAV
jgi:hypothetical protein